MKAVFRVQPIERGGVKGIAGHNARMPGHESDHIDPARTGLNFYLRGDEKIENALREVIRDVPMARGCKDKSKENIAAEFVMSASPEFFDQGGDVKKWAEKSLAWIDKQFLGRCISCVVHLDEETPHLHAILRVDVEKSRLHPVTKEPMQSKRVLSYSDFFMDRKDVLTKARLLGTSHLDTKLGRLQTSYAEAVSMFGLERGECSARSKRSVQHLTPAEFRQREKALEEQAVILEQTKKVRADLAALQKGVGSAKVEKATLEKEAAALAQKIEERQKESKGVEAALESKKSEVAAVEKQVAKLYVQYEKNRTALQGWESGAAAGEKKAAALCNQIVALENTLTEKKGEVFAAEKLTGEMVVQYDKAKKAAEAWGQEVEKLKSVVAEKNPLPTWLLLCEQSGSASAAADFVKSLPEAVARAVANTASGETQEKLLNMIRVEHEPAPAPKRARGMRM